MYTGVSLKDQGQVEVKQRSTNELYHIITRHELRKMKVEVKMFEDYTVVIKKSWSILAYSRNDIGEEQNI